MTNKVFGIIYIIMGFISMIMVLFLNVISAQYVWYTTITSICLTMAVTPFGAILIKSSSKTEQNSNGLKIIQSLLIAIIMITCITSRINHRVSIDIASLCVSFTASLASCIVSILIGRADAESEESKNENHKTW